MPTYDYKCEKCSHVFEVFQLMKAVRVKACPECGGKVERLIGSGSGIIFKGSGFYATDYKKKGKKAGKDDTSASKPSEACKKCPNTGCKLKSEKPSDS